MLVLSLTHGINDQNNPDKSFAYGGIYSDASTWHGIFQDGDLRLNVTAFYLGSHAQAFKSVGSSQPVYSGCFNSQTGGDTKAGIFHTEDTEEAFAGYPTDVRVGSLYGIIMQITVMKI